MSAAVAHMCSGSPRIMVPVDLRRHDPELRSTANLALPLFLDVTPGQNWEEINAQLLKGMTLRQELSEIEGSGLSAIPGWITRGMLRSAHTLGGLTGSNAASAIVSHAGKVDLDKYATSTFTATSVRAVPAATGLVPVSFALVEHGNHTEITVSARGGRGVAAGLEQLLDHIERVLTATAETAVAPTRVVPALPVDNGAPSRETALSLFAQQVRANPDAAAVISPDTTVSYRELDRRSTNIAAQLIQRGVTPGAVVAVLADRTIAGMAAQLGVMKAGSTFLPLDSHHPASRIQVALADSGAVLALVEKPHVDLVGEVVRDVVILDESVQAESESAPVFPDVSPDDAVYVTYTSGSTGRPKGVLVPHRGVVSFVEAGREWYQLGPETRFGHYHTPAADMACAAFFSALLTGGAITLLPDDVSPVSLRHMLTESGANTFLLTPSLVGSITRLGIDVPSLRTIIIGGEKLYSSLARTACEFFGPDTRIVNSYGPTELSIVCSNHVIASGHPDQEPVTSIGLDRESVPIGRAPARTPVFLLDEQGHSVPDGEVGELYFGGPQVALGYLGRSDLTAQKFVTVDSEFTYRTGDLARLIPGETLEFVGRIDDQVKIRGNRIEPGEVQAALEAHRDVKACAVVVRKRADDGSPMLVGYVIPEDVAPQADGTQQLDIAGLRAHLADFVPTYMIPAALIGVPELPVTLNGKLDLAALPLPAAADAGVAATDASAPAEASVNADAVERSPQWTAIAQIWGEVLSVNPSALEDDSDFFVLGGDSLAAVDMLAKVSRQVVTPGGEAKLVAALDGFAHQLTLSRVYEAALSVSTD
ncbi:MAG: non-ribosomal peptide synthetase [Rhodococcus sp.]|nr:non-ribosomal peptide synthetase [Rhodococcus sp. (in: high G+C Gram-positive bacteria)]